MKTKRILPVLFLVVLALSGNAYGQQGNAFFPDPNAGENCDTCSFDTFIGVAAGLYDRSSSGNTYVGNAAGSSLGWCYDHSCYATGVENTFIGNQTGYNIDSGSKNTFVGRKAGYGGANITGSYNTYIGYDSGHYTTSGGNNTALGNAAGLSNSDGNLNIFIGESAGYYNHGHWNTIVGAFAGQNNHTGSANVFIGANAGSSETGDNKLYIDNCIHKDGSGNCTIPLISGDFNAQTVNINGTLTVPTLTPTNGIQFSDGTWQTTGLSGLSSSLNSYFGYQAGYGNSIGSNDTFLGSQAGYSNNSGSNNSFVGYQSGHSNTYGSHNTFVGDSAGRSNSTGNDNTFMGYQAGYSNTTTTTAGSSNTFLGSGAGYANSTGSINTFLGISAGTANITGNDNAFVGSFAGDLNTSGSRNTFVGNYAGHYSSTGSWNVFLGYSAGHDETGSDKLYIDNCHYGNGFNCTNPLIYGKFDTRLVQINGTLIMGGASSLSDVRLKKNIEPLKSSLEKVVHLQGVSYEWTEEGGARRGLSKDRQIGLIAQDVEAVIPEVVQTDNEGYKALAYDKVVPVLIEAMKEQQALIKDLQRKNERLEQRLLALEAK